LRSLLLDVDPDRVVVQRWGASFLYLGCWGFHDHLWNMWEAGIIVKGSEVALVPWKIGVLSAIALPGLFCRYAPATMFDPARTTWTSRSGR
jgi:hypothetical protein